MADCQSIGDRDGFGHWLSGFADGEGCFRLLIIHNKRPNRIYDVPTARFELLLRYDDEAILREIREYWGIGSLGTRKESARSSAAARLYISSAFDLARIVVPHFHRYPLRAKKRYDFEVWRRGVALIYQVTLRPQIGKTGPGAIGTHPRWTDAEKAEFITLIQELEQIRLAPPPSPAGHYRAAAGQTDPA
jgi:hypothetical protein